MKEENPIILPLLLSGSCTDNSLLREDTHEQLKRRRQLEATPILDIAKALGLELREEDDGAAYIKCLGPNHRNGEEGLPCRLNKEANIAHCPECFWHASGRQLIGQVRSVDVTAAEEWFAKEFPPSSPATDVPPATNTKDSGGYATVMATLIKHANDQGSEIASLILRTLKPTDFQMDADVILFFAVEMLRKAGSGIDQNIIIDWIRTNWTDCLKQLRAEARYSTEPEDVERHLQRLYGFPTLSDTNVLSTYMQRITNLNALSTFESVLHAAREMVPAVTGDFKRGRVEQGVAKIRLAAATLQQATSRSASKPVTETEEVDLLLEDLAKRTNTKGFAGLDSGFKHLNHVLNGLDRGLIIAAGPPSCGKTTLMKQIIDEVAEKENVPVVFFSYEQSAEELRIKTLARLARVDTRDIIKGRTDHQVTSPGSDGPETLIWDQVVKAAEKYKTFSKHVKIIEAGRETITEKIQLTLQDIKRRAKADKILVVIDYLQIMPAVDPLTNRPFPSTKDRVDFLCSELRRLARELDSPIIAISSENREAYKSNKKPTMAAFKESGGIEYSADVAIALWTDRHREDDNHMPDLFGSGSRTPKDHKRDITLFVLKNRNGELAEITLSFQPDIATFTEQGRAVINYTDSLVEKDSMARGE